LHYGIFQLYEPQERLVSVSKKDVEHEFGNDLKHYAKEYHIKYDTLLEEEALRNLYSYDYVFNI
tara:strand:- start:150 stop:341 length:192 start_codon:yes stop_codon:yes gene_type:complete